MFLNLLISRNVPRDPESQFFAGLGETNKFPLWKHVQIAHGGSMEVSYSMKVVRYCRDPLTRQVNEAVRISKCEVETQLNSKSEWHGPVTVRLVSE